MIKEQQQRYHFQRDGDRLGIHLLFDVPRVSQGMKYPPMTEEEIAKLLISRINNTTVYDKQGKWVRELSY